MLEGLIGWHVLIVAVVLLVIAALVVGVHLLIRAGCRSTRKTVDQTADIASRLSELDQLRARGLVTEAEYATKRAEILGDL